LTLGAFHGGTDEPNKAKILDILKSFSFKELISSINEVLNEGFNTQQNKMKLNVKAIIIYTHLMYNIDYEKLFNLLESSIWTVLFKIIFFIPTVKPNENIHLFKTDIEKKDKTLLFSQILSIYEVDSSQHDLDTRIINKIKTIKDNYKYLHEKSNWQGNAKTLCDFMTTNLLTKTGGTNVLFILGRKRKIYKIGRTKYITYKRNPIKLSLAKKLDKKTNK
jgi:hypothetical protein